MTRSRLRRPMSKSMTATRLPRRASPHARLADVVVLPTPPLPDVTTMISAVFAALRAAGPSAARARSAGRGGATATDVSSDVTSSTRSVSLVASVMAYPPKVQIVAVEPRLHGFARQIRRDGLENTEHAGDGHQLGIEFVAEHSRADFAAHSSDRPAAQRAVHVHAAVCHDFGARADCARYDQIAMTRVNPLA